MIVAFDTLKLADRLEAAGMSRQRAKGVATALAETLTGAVDVAELRDAIHETELHLRGEIATVRTGIAGLRVEVPRWMFGQTFVILGAIAALFGVLR